jgi:hypothetical protein
MRQVMKIAGWLQNSALFSSNLDPGFEIKSCGWIARVAQLTKSFSSLYVSWLSMMMKRQEDHSEHRRGTYTKILLSVVHT